MRPFLTRFVGSVGRSLPLLPFLAICLACATPTPFPVENLKVGMTTKEVRQSVGEPRFNHLGKTWIYTHEEQDWVGFVVRKDVFLHFDEEKLVQWQVTEPFPAVSSGISEDDWDWMDQHQWDRSKDARHHKKGHKHHHPDC